ncbi:MMPL family transporter [Dongia soli]|uniref:Exporter n=1 Tax=Dongia soli TaxID=600628 RepID=A0ABU5EG74_9PROT|nr:hypothetical protein [Dongia soli]MDY0885221.1 hypothetical protein [Dongia soli]
MRRLLALIWLVVLLALTGHLAWKYHAGLQFSTDILALLPREAETPLLEKANQAVTDAVSRRVVLLIGDPDRATARDVAAKLGQTLATTGLVRLEADSLSGDRLKKLGALYFPFRHNLLSPRDRSLLLAGDGEEVATNALSQIYGFVGLTDARLIAHDPFLLLQSFLTQLPVPMSRLSLDDGMLTTSEKGITWILVTGTLMAEPFALDVQQQLIGPLDKKIALLRQQHAELQVKRLGAVFFAAAGSQVAMKETSTLGLVSTIGSVLLLLLTFRRIAPLWQNLLVVGIGAGAALSVSLFLFDHLHVAVLLFGVSLIGIAVDYGMYYYSSLFDPDCRTPEQRLRSVLPGITLGYVTTLLGYAILILAPFPGLRQIAIFSVIGLSASFVTVLLWFPLIDRLSPARHGAGMLHAAGMLWRFWEQPDHRVVRRILGAILCVAAVIGLLRLHADDDVRKLQSLSPDLLAQQTEIQRLIGSTTSTQFLLVHAADDETALQREEQLAPLLDELRSKGVLHGYQSPAAFIPSAARQRENRRLIDAKLNQPYLTQQVQQLGLPMPKRSDDNGAVLTLDRASAEDSVPFLGSLVLQPGIHVVMLDGLRDTGALRTAIQEVDGVRVIDPTGDYTILLSKYRYRAVWLIVVGVLLMMPVLIWRYGWLGAILVKAPSVTAITLAAAAIGLAGEGFTFFHAMALILVQSIGVDFAVFCAESGRNRQSVTMLGVWLATLTTLLSFGVLAFSRVAAVHAFGLTMLVGLIFAFLLAPVAGSAKPRRDWQNKWSQSGVRKRETKPLYSAIHDAGQVPSPGAGPEPRAGSGGWAGPEARAGHDAGPAIGWKD